MKDSLPGYFSFSYSVYMENSELMFNRIENSFGEDFLHGCRVLAQMVNTWGRNTSTRRSGVPFSAYLILLCHTARGCDDSEEAFLRCLSRPLGKFALDDFVRFASNPLKVNQNHWEKKLRGIMYSFSPEFDLYAAVMCCFTLVFLYSCTLWPYIFSLWSGTKVKVKPVLWIAIRTRFY